MNPRTVLPVRIALTAFILLLIVAGPSLAQQKEWTIGDFSAEIGKLTERVSPAVVQIYTSSFGAMMAPQTPGGAVFGQQLATGSGVILDSDGFIITNNHVVEGAKRVQVRLSPDAIGAEKGDSIVRTGGALVGAQVLGVDKETDLALLKINRKDLPTLPLGDSDELHQGQLVFAFGSPMGLNNSVSFGVVSTVARQLSRDNPMIYVQTDVAINPGNSGGPLVNVQGEVVGINTLIFTQSGGSEGLSFSAPSNIVRTVYESIRANGRVKRGIIGVHAQTLNPWVAEGLGLPVEWGVILGDVYPNGPAAQAGLQVGDIVLSLDGKKMENGRQFEVNTYGKKIGSQVALEIMRGGETMTKNVTVIERVEPDYRFIDMISAERNLVKRLGVLALDLDNESRALLPIQPRSPQGVIVAGMTADVTLLGESFAPGDIIYSLNGKPVASVGTLRDVIKEIGYGQPAIFHVERGGQLRFLVVELE